MVDTRILKWLEDIQLVSTDRYNLIQQARTLILGLHAGVSEEVKYGGILFASPLGTPFCGLFAYTNHVSLEFSGGAALPDQFKMLEGSGKQRRHIKLISLVDIQNKYIAHYLDLALKAAAKDDAFT